jgi:hypothetical protein
MRKRLQQLEKRSREAESSLSLKQQQAHQKYQQNPDLLAAYKEGELTIVQELVKPTGISGSSTIEIIRGLLAVCEEHKAALEQLRSEHRADRSRQLRRLAQSAAEDEGAAHWRTPGHRWGNHHHWHPEVLHFIWHLRVTTMHTLPVAEAAVVALTGHTCLGGLLQTQGSRQQSNTINQQHTRGKAHQEDPPCHFRADLSTGLHNARRMCWRMKKSHVRQRRGSRHLPQQGRNPRARNRRRVKNNQRHVKLL